MIINAQDRFEPKNIDLRAFALKMQGVRGEVINMEEAKLEMFIAEMAKLKQELLDD